MSFDYAKELDRAIENLRLEARARWRCDCQHCDDCDGHELIAASNTVVTIYQRMKRNEQEKK